MRSDKKFKITFFGSRVPLSNPSATLKKVSLVSNDRYTQKNKKNIQKVLKTMQSFNHATIQDINISKTFSSSQKNIQYPYIKPSIVLLALSDS